jgi:hypothetical protein
MSMVGNARYFEDGSLSMLIGKSLLCGPKKGGLPVDQCSWGKAWGEAPRFSLAVVH